MVLRGVVARWLCALLLILPAALVLEPPPVPAQELSNAPTKLVALDPAPSATSPRALAEPFGLDVVPATGGDLSAKWAGVATQIKAEQEVLARCRDNDSATTCPAAARTFLDVVALGRSHDGRARIGVINRAINLAIRPMSDVAQWGVADRWTAPLDTLTSGRGDCEDYAIAKYAALIDAGVAPEDLRLVIIHDLVVDEDHAVVAAHLDGGWIILDNRWLALVADVDLRRAVPLFVLDQDGVKQFTAALADSGRAALPPAPGSLRY
jgi:predicted transglutaminase-like cysteine proteinase